MAINDIRKINVRSPYYITVEDEFEPDVPIPPDPDPPTEPVVSTIDLACGNSINYAAAVGVKKIRISTANRQYGDYTVTFSNITIPIKYRIYNEGNATGSYTTKGLSQYADEWLENTGEVLSGTAGTAPISATLTHTTNSGNNNGENLILEILAPMPIIGTVVEITSCASEVVAPSPSTSGYVTVITLYNTANLTRWVSGLLELVSGTSAVTIKLNDVNITLPSAKVNGGIRIICSDVTPDWIVDPTTLPYIGNKINASNLPVWANWTYSESGNNGQMTTVYVNESALTSSLNKLEVRTQADHLGQYKLLIASHPTSESGGVNKILTHNNSETVTGVQMTLNHTLGTDYNNDQLFNRNNIYLSDLNEELPTISSNIFNSPKYRSGEFFNAPQEGVQFNFSNARYFGI
ncbi:MAG: hypothetical protein CMJ25_10300 [Phycisphaerae bacterium]|nr:hypothetical protein [Phycisphaerae bacterium]|tara:strand:+ start:1543 stop:2763 length:1221 start_codon:yes stop_codon:yes gene_type:complete